MGLQRYYFDVYGVKPEILRDIGQMRSLWRNLAQTLGLTLPCTNTIVCFDQVPPADTGVSVVGVGDNCHITCHSFDKRRTVFVDCCFPQENQDLADAIDVLMHALNSTALEICHKPVGDGEGKFGKHIVLELPAYPEEHARDLLERLIGEIGMHPLSGCMSFSNDRGYSVIRPIMESHLALHTRGRVTELDIFSCRNFAEEKIQMVLPEAKVVQRIERGRYYPEPIF